MNKFQQIGLLTIDGKYRRRSPFTVQLWWIIQDTLFAFSPQFLYGWRNLLLRFFGAKIGQNVRIRSSARFTFPWKVSIEDYSRIGDNVVFYSLGEIQIGKHTVVSQRSYLCTGSHDYHKLTFDLLIDPITVGDEVWLAADVFVGPGVHIGNGAVIGVRSTVLEDLPEGMICFGNPAKPVKERLVEIPQVSSIGL